MDQRNQIENVQSRDEESKKDTGLSDSGTYICPEFLDPNRKPPALNVLRCLGNGAFGKYSAYVKSSRLCFPCCQQRHQRASSP